MTSSHKDLVSPSTWWVHHVRPADGDVTTSTAWRLLKPPLRPATIFIPRSAVTPRGSDRSFHGTTPRFRTLKMRQRGGKAWRIVWQWVKHQATINRYSDSGGGKSITCLYHTWKLVQIEHNYDKIENTMSTAPDAIPLTAHYHHHHQPSVTTAAWRLESVLLGPIWQFVCVNSPTYNQHTHTSTENTSHTVDNACNILCAFIQFKIPNISVGSSMAWLQQDLC